MKAVRVHNYGGPGVLTYEDVPEPRARKSEAVVKIAAAGLNFEVSFAEFSARGGLE